MNEETRKLIEQAGGDFWQRLENNVVKKDAYVTFDPPEKLEKLVELIVKECMTMCDETRADYFKHRKAADDFTDKNIYAEGEAASDIIKYKMKKHFGVK
jgi:hypothetical protein